MSIQKPSLDSITQDFQRDAWCLFGLPVDNLTLEDTKKLIKRKACSTGSAILSTINVNWIVHSLIDPSFRNSIICSEIVTIDGKPLLWLSKILGYPMTEVVPGSTLINSIKDDINAKRVLSIFLFGGDNENARKALQNINQISGGLWAVDAFNPGFGSVEDMSSEVIINRINQSNPDILLVALGAKKGTEWIKLNRNRLNAKIISHLGATINFLGGTIRRAPNYMQKFGIEWIWRIIQEPKLFSRYFNDGVKIMKWIVIHFHLFVYYLALKSRFRTEECDETVILHNVKNELILHLGRKLYINKSSVLRNYFIRCAHENKNITIDFRNTEIVDGSFMGMLLLLLKYQELKRKKLHLRNISKKLNRIFKLFCIDLSIESLCDH